MSQALHQTVLLNEAIDGLQIKPDGHYVDLTFGRGGHSEAILKALGPKGRLWGFDQDPTSVPFASRLKDIYPQFSFIHQNFSALEQVLATGQLGDISGLDGILMDLGVSSPQLDEPSRGFSFRFDGPLDMRMDTRQGMTAAEWIASASIEEMTDVIKTFGEERFGKRIATKIAEVRTDTPIVTTKALVDVIVDAMPVIDKHKHPATRTFQAIRIHINGELSALQAVLPQALAALNPSGRLVAISFHSLEDRIVKRFFQKHSQIHLPPGVSLSENELNRELKIVARKVKASQSDVEANPRARSAVMRVAEKT